MAGEEGGIQTNYLSNLTSKQLKLPIPQDKMSNHPSASEETLEKSITNHPRLQQILQTLLSSLSHRIPLELKPPPSFALLLIIIHSLT